MSLPITVVHVLTYNQDDIQPCINSILQQEGFELGKNLKILVTDNNSSNNLAEKLKRLGDNISLTINNENLGFSRGHNLGIEKALSLGAEYIFIANPDIVLEKDCLKNMVLALDSDESAGLSTPLIFRADENLNPVLPKVFDACGMYFNDSIRHLDRGSNQTDNGKYRDIQYMLGGTGAALLIKKNFIEDCRLDRIQTNNSELELFDNNFFLYREDAELSLRGQIFGWNCLYVPNAILYHTRVVVPENRAEIPEQYNLFSVRNRFLLQINDFSALLLLICFKGSIFRNLLVILACILKERSSIPGLRQVIKLFPSAYKKRRYIFSKRRRSDLILKEWFFKKGVIGENILKTTVGTKGKSSIVIINYNSGDRLKDSYLSSKKSLEILDKEVRGELITIDNNSSDLSTDFLKNEGSLIKNEKNLGFSGACNQGIRCANSDYVLILNPDITLEEDTLDKLSNVLNCYPEIGAVGASLLNKDKSPQLGFVARKFPSTLSTLLELVGISKYFPSNIITKNYLIKDDINFSNYLNETFPEHSPRLNPEKPYLVDQPAGACLLIRKKAFDEIGGFDENFYPAWFEDVDFCLRLKKFGYKLAVLSSAKAIHEGGYSLSTMKRTQFFEIWYKNLNYYFSKHKSYPEQILVKGFTKIIFAVRSYF